MAIIEESLATARRGKVGRVNVELFATNLHNPTHMEWTPDGRLLVSEHTAGRVKDITAGGDMRDAKPFAYGLRGPSSILPLGDRLLISETWSDCVTDITSGGDASGAGRYATELSSPYSLSALPPNDGAEQRVFVSERFGRFRGQITEITGGGVRSDFKPYITDVPVRTTVPGRAPIEFWPDKWEFYSSAVCEDAPWHTVYQGALYFEVAHLGQIIRAPEDGGVHAELEDRGCIVAWGLDRIGGMKEHPYDGRIYAVQPERGNIVAVDPSDKRNYCFDPPVVQGFKSPSCARFGNDGETMYVCDSGHGVIWKVTNFL